MKLKKNNGANPIFYYMLAMSLFETKDYEQAIATCDKAIQVSGQKTLNSEFFRIKAASIYCSEPTNRVDELLYKSLVVARGLDYKLLEIRSLISYVHYGSDHDEIIKCTIQLQEYMSYMNHLPDKFFVDNWELSAARDLLTCKVK
eukprot:NODE_7939_length_727_cov_14.783113_g7323_i0.p1 GENE.NODE_7939_length_727_cov_14.783113_g7323_i0~~NODE_7939_length_727_cov_14.783113_g7323_i0.p1  ORF type:complete len:145 (+),score=23.99 NODE_7939_length_727_cov_14.783113_g7323_i0:193-627(+)